jgi:hypothetical protein
MNKHVGEYQNGTERYGKVKISNVFLYLTQPEEAVD